MKKLRNWRETAELVGIAAIVASLVFVGIQIQQDRYISHREAHSAFVDSRIELVRLLSENRESWIEGLKGSVLSEQEQWTFNALVRVVYFDRYNRYARRRMGVEVTDNADDLARFMALRMYQYPGYRKAILAFLDKRRMENGGPADGMEGAFQKAVVEALAEIDRNNPALGPPDYLFL